MLKNVKRNEYLERIKEALERSVSYRDAAKIARADIRTIKECAQALGYPNYTQLYFVWNYFNREIEKVYREIREGRYVERILHNFREMLSSYENRLSREPFECPIDGFKTYRLERATGHVIRKHPEIWKKVEKDLFSMLSHLGKCTMVTQNPKEYTEDDFLFEAIERSSDPNSIFSDEDFVIALFKTLKSNKNTQL
jgi:hypothetical protein